MSNRHSKIVVTLVSKTETLLPVLSTHTWENDDHHHWHSMKKGSIESSGKHCPFFMLSTPTSYSRSLWGFWNKYPICILSGFWLSGEERVKMLIRTLQQIVKFENGDRHLEYITYWSFISAFPQKKFGWQNQWIFISRDNVRAT